MVDTLVLVVEKDKSYPFHPASFASSLQIPASNSNWTHQQKNINTLMHACSQLLFICHGGDVLKEALCVPVLVFGVRSVQLLLLFSVTYIHTSIKNKNDKTNVKQAEHTHTHTHS